MLQPIIHLPNPNRPIVQYVNEQTGRPYPCGYSTTSLYPVNHQAIDYVLGPEAKRDFIANHPHLNYYEKPKADQRSTIMFNQRQVHGHPLGGFIRTHADLGVKLSVARGMRGLDIGGSKWRNINSGDVDHRGFYINRRLAERWHTMAPIIEGGRDEHREINLKLKIAQSEDKDMLQALHDNYTCGHVGSGRVNPNLLCPCEQGNFQVVNMTDSIYYPGVLLQAFKTMIRNEDHQCVAYASAFDYHATWLANKRSGKAADNESTFTFCREGICHEVKGNLASYKHSIFRTDGKECFFIAFRDRFFNFETIRRQVNGDLEYATWKITMTRHRVEHMHEITDQYLFSPYVGDEVIPIGKQCLAQVKDFAYYSKQAMKKNTREMSVKLVKSVEDTLSSFKHLAISSRETMEYLPETDEFKMTICEGNLLGLPFGLQTFIVDAEPVEFFFASFLYRRGLSENTRITRAAYHALTAEVPEGARPGANAWGLSIKQATDIQKVTAILAQRVGADLLETVMTTQSKRRLDQVMTSPFKYKVGPSLSRFIGTVVSFTSLAYILFLLINFLKPVHAYTGLNNHNSEETPFGWVQILICGIVVGLIKECTYLWNSRHQCKARTDHDVQMWYETDCEHNDSNCDLSMVGRVDPKFRVKGEIMKQFPNKWICDAKQKVGPVVVGPRCFGLETNYIGTQNHNCARSTASSIKRMISRLCTGEDHIMKEFFAYVRKYQFPKFAKAMNEEGMKIEMEEWKKRYPILYRDELARLEADPDYFVPKKGSNKMFCKTDEINVPTFNHDERISSLNKIKKRAICDPDHQDKARVNAFCYFMSKLASKADERYDVGKNYMQTADYLDGFQEIPNLICLAADGSGFDQTQGPEVNELVLELVQFIRQHFNFESDQDLDFKLFIDTFIQQLILNVSCFNGQLKFKAEGRGSGHGWTTVFNTLLNIWYYAFLMYKAGVQEHEWKGAFAGDDSLIGVGAQHIGSIEYWRKKLFLEKDQKIAHGLGQICKKIKYGRLDEMDYKSCHIFFTDNGDCRLTRIAGRVLPTAGVSTTAPKPPGSSQMTDEEIAEFYDDPVIIAECREAGRKKAFSGLDYSRGTFWERFYMKYLELCGGGEREEDDRTEYEKQRENYTHDQAVWIGVGNDYDAHRAWFCDRYDVTNDLIDDFLECVEAMTSFRDVLYHPLVDAVLRVDNC